MSNLLIWSAGRSGPYKATANAAWYGGDLISTCGADMLMKHDKIKAHRDFCQRHAWKNQGIRAIESAILYCGVSTLAHALKVDSSRLSKWRRGVALVPPKYCKQIAELSRVPVDELRPDLEFYRPEASATLCGAAELSLIDPPLKWRKRSLTVGGAES